MATLKILLKSFKNNLCTTVDTMSRSGTRLGKWIDGQILVLQQNLRNNWLFKYTRCWQSYTMIENEEIPSTYQEVTVELCCAQTDFSNWCEMDPYSHCWEHHICDVKTQPSKQCVYWMLPSLGSDGVFHLHWKKCCQNHLFAKAGADFSSSLVLLKVVHINKVLTFTDWHIYKRDGNKNQEHHPVIWHLLLSIFAQFAK